MLRVKKMRSQECRQRDKLGPHSDLHHTDMQMDIPASPSLLPWQLESHQGTLCVITADANNGNTLICIIICELLQLISDMFDVWAMVAHENNQ